MTVLQHIYCALVALASGVGFIALGYYMLTRPFPHHKRDRRERLPNPAWRARVYQPHHHSRWWV
jgi:uncharacterized membrane protein YfcA